MTAMLRESEAWMIIAKRFGERTPDDGLCEATGVLQYIEGLISLDMQSLMVERLEGHMRAMESPRLMYAFYERDGDWHDLRCLAALFLSYEAAEDEAQAAQRGAA